MPAAYRYHLTEQGIEVNSFFLSKQFLSVLQIISALLSGIGIAINWTTMGYYVNMCGDEVNRGRFNGIVLTYFTGGYLCALIFAGFVADNYGLLALYSLIPMVTVFAGLVTLGLPKPEPLEEKNEIEEVELGQVPQ